MEQIYIIGGSPCSGKSTVAEILSAKYGLRYFKADDRLESYISRGASMNREMCKKQAERTPEETWMREPLHQCREALLLYEEIIDFLMDDLKRIGNDKAVITEGAAYLPYLMKRRNLPRGRYIAITPEKEFQVSHYSQRGWIHSVLQGCSDKEQAFRNWMERDALFAAAVNKQCEEAGYSFLVNSGKLTIEELADVVCVHFGLKS